MNYSKLEALIFHKFGNYNQIGNALTGLIKGKSMTVRNIINRRKAEVDNIEKICNVLQISPAELYFDIKYKYNEETKKIEEIFDAEIDKINQENENIKQVLQNLTKNKTSYTINEEKNDKVSDIDFEYEQKYKISDLLDSIKEKDNIIKELLSVTSSLREINQAFLDGKIMKV